MIKKESKMWKPIKTAPKDGTVIDLWSEKYRCRITNSAWHNGLWLAADAPIPNDKDITHWMPTPLPPKGCDNE